MSSEGTLVSVIAGLAAGIGFILIFSLMFQIGITDSVSRRVSVVTIPEDASMPGSIGFEPKVIKVVIGTNNTVRWINEDTIVNSVYADDESDPLFYNATKGKCENNDYDNCVAIFGKNDLLPGQTFEFTFTKLGVFRYHSVPHPQMKGTVVVYPHNWQAIGFVPTEPAIYEGQAIDSVLDYLDQRVRNFTGITLYSTSSDFLSSQSRYVNVTEFFRMGNELPLRYYPQDSSGGYYSIDPVQHKIIKECTNSGCLPNNDVYTSRLKGKLVYLLDTTWPYRSEGPLASLPDGFFVDAYSGDVVATSFRCPEERQEWCK